MPEGYRETEIGPLPETWEIKKLEELVSYRKGKKPQTLVKDYDFEHLPYLTANYFRTGEAKQFVPKQEIKETIVCEGHDTVLIWDGSNSGDTFTGLRGVLASTMVKVLPESPELDSSFIYFFLKTQFGLLNSQTTGSTIPHVNKNLFRNLPTPLPPLHEQKAIAHVLRTVQKAIETTEQVIEVSREMKRSLMNHLFTYGSVSVYEAEQVPLKETEIGLVPEHWDQVVLEEVAEIAYGVQAAVANMLDATLGFPILTNINVTNEGELDLQTLRYYPISDKKRENLLLKKGDLLFNWRSGSKNHIGKTALFDLEGSYTFSSFILRFRASNRINNRFLLYYLQRLTASGFFVQHRQQSSVNSVFNASVAAKLSVALPSLVEQNQIIEVLSSVDRKISTEKNRKQSLNVLLRTLLHDLMSGKVRVNDLDLHEVEERP